MNVAMGGNFGGAFAINPATGQIIRHVTKSGTVTYLTKSESVATGIMILVQTAASVILLGRFVVVAILRSRAKKRSTG